MEKIYMEESKKSRKSVMSSSVILSFVFSIFSIFAIAMYGIFGNQGTSVSYAANVPDGSDFNLSWGDEITACNNQDCDKMYSMINYYTGTARTLANQVFCIERTKQTENGSTYKDMGAFPADWPNVKNDNGLAYLLGLGRVGKKITNYDSSIDGFVLQSAIWYYLADKYPDVDVFKLVNKTDGGGQVLNDKAVIETAGDIYIQKGTGSATPYSGLTGQNGKILQLVNEAKKDHSYNTFTLELEDDKTSKTEDGKYYQSSKFTPVGSDVFASYSLKVTGVDDAVIVNENGEEISADNIPAGTKFYVRVPVDKITKETLIKVDARGMFYADGVKFYYAPSDPDTLQHMAYVEPYYVNAGAEFTVVGDTGLNVTQTIYFVGLIVLLCGVGIVYANAKPVESKQ